MPTYEFLCRKCDGKFTVDMKMSEHGSKRVKCPDCKSTSVRQQYTTFFAKTSRKS